MARLRAPIFTLWSKPAKPVESIRTATSTGCSGTSLWRPVSTTTTRFCPGKCLLPCAEHTPRRSAIQGLQLHSQRDVDNGSLTANPQGQRYLNIAASSLAAGGSYPLVQFVKTGLPAAYNFGSLPVLQSKTVRLRDPRHLRYHPLSARNRSASVIADSPSLPAARRLPPRRPLRVLPRRQLTGVQSVGLLHIPVHGRRSQSMPEQG
ncbi:hypothetical protein QF001_000794 [Paraburkholderia youngii]